MRGLRKIRLLRTVSAWAAIVATIFHVAMLSLHIAAGFERGLAPQQDVTASLGIHAFCGVDVPQSDAALALGEQTEPASEKSDSNCPLCVGAAPVACIDAPVGDVIPFEFVASVARSYTALVEGPVQPWTHTGTIRGPPTII